MKKVLFLMLVLVSTTFAVEFKSDEKLVQGQLKNGLKYYIYPNSKPSNKLSVRIKIKAGSLYENTGEEGLAHFLEHLAFNGTEKYPKNDLIRILEGKGVAFGNDLNAFTSFDQTVFMLDGQTKDLNDFLDIMHQWAFRINFTDEEVNKEKGVVIEEWRQRTGLDKELQDFVFKYLFRNSKYLDRLPIGKVPSIEKFTAKNAKDFYKKWYVPNNMSIFVAGDISNAKEIVNNLEKLFGKESKKILPDAEAFKKRKIVETNKYDVFQNDQLKTNDFTFFQMFPVVQPKNQLEEITIKQLTTLFTVAFNQRYAEKLNNLDTNLNGISIGSQNMNDYFGFDYIGLSLKNNKELAGINEGFREFNQTKLGFLPVEFSEAAQALVLSFENAIEEDKNQDTSVIVSALLNTDFDKYKYIGLTDYYKKAIEVINKLNVSDLNKFITTHFKSPENYYLLQGYTKLDEKDIKEQVEAGLNTKVKPFERTATNGSIITKEISPGAITIEEYNKDLDYNTLTLSNGSKVYVKKIDYEKNSVSFTAVSKGGKSYIETTDIPDTSFLNVVANSAPGTMTKAEYDRYTLSKAPFSINYSVNDDSEYFFGNTTPLNFNELLMNFYAFVTEPKVDEKQLNLSKTEALEWLKSRTNSKETGFWDEYDREFTLNDPRDLLITEAQVNSVTSENVLNLYKERLSNGIDYDYYIVGDLNYDEVKDGIKNYLASLNTGVKETYKILPEKVRTENIRYERDLGLGENSKVVLDFGNNAPLGENYEYFKTMARQTLETEILKVLREDMGGVYSPSVDVTISKHYLDRANWHLYFSCDPTRVEELLAAEKVVIDKVIGGQISDDTISYIKESYLANYNRNLNTNGFYTNYFENIILDEKQDMLPEEFNKLVTKENIADFIKKTHGGYEINFILNPAKN